MIEQEQTSQLSALFDGELQPQQAQMVIRRALRDPAMRASWERYALIGACLRAEPISRHNSVADRVQASLAAERELNVSPLPVRRERAIAAGGMRPALLGRGALGGAIAAAVAVVSILVVREMAPSADDAGALLGQGAAQVASAIDAGAGQQEIGYTTPGENAPVQRRIVDTSLGHFLVAHSEEAAAALRFSYDSAPLGVELTEDQISALR